MVVDVVDFEVLVAVRLACIAHKARHLRVVVELSARACANLRAAQPRTLVVADHRLIEDVAIDVGAPEAKREYEREHGERLGWAACARR